ncbi:MAG: ArnT family glycosyltransferase [Polyangiales bacterium]
MASLLLLRLSGFGIWDPWEVEIADPARRLSEGQAVAVPHIGLWLVSKSFHLLGVSEWSGRLPIALGGIATALLAFVLVDRLADRRTAIYTVLITGTSPLFIFNARTMLGEAPVFAIQTAIALCAAMSVFCRRGPLARGAWLLGTLLVCGLGIAARGALLCVLPPLGAVVLATLLAPRTSESADPRPSAVSAYALGALTLCLALLVARAVAADHGGYDPWLGGAPEGGQPPGFDALLERVFHGFAPWSALLPVALARLPAAPSAEAEHADAERRLRLLLAAWIGLSYAALTLFTSRYGHRAAVVPVVALAAAVALLLRDMERARARQWPVAICGLFLCLLLMRDFSLYPVGPLHGMPIADFSVPDVFNPIGAWSLALGVFACTLVLALGAYDESPRALDLRGPYRWLAQQWRRGLPDKLWLAALALSLLGIEAFGVACFVPSVASGVGTLAARAGKALALVPPALPLALLGAQAVLHAYAKLGELRNVPLLIAGLGVGGYAAFGFMPALSAHFSPREVYETYNTLAKPGETLIEYKVGARAAAYYARGAAAEVETVGQLMERLVSPQRRWAVFPSEELPAIDRLFRTRQSRHLFVADARNARALLATNQPIPGRKDQSFLSEFVRRDAPPIQHPVQADFDGKLTLLGYDLKLPHGDHVGAGEHFELTWYFKTLKPAGNNRIFVHIDDQTMRIHGDHDPVDDRYPVRLWEPGDVIIDKQTLEVPSSYPAGAYTIFMGFYAGETRMPVKSGPHDDADRVIAGVLRIR